MATTRSLEIAAQCWCDPRTSDREMDAALAEVFAEKLDAEAAEKEPAIRPGHSVFCLSLEVKRLQAIVDKLPTTADGVPVVPGMMLYLPRSAYMGRAMFHANGFVCGNGGPLCGQCYSTRKAAEAAEKGE